MATGITTCNRYAPKASVEQPRDDCPIASDYSRTLWPIVHEKDWCGEFKPKEGTPSDMLTKGLPYLELTTRSQNALEWNGVKTIGQLVEKSHRELCEIRNMGSASVREVKRKLADLGLSLRYVPPKYSKEPNP